MDGDNVDTVHVISLLRDRIVGNTDIGAKQFCRNSENEGLMRTMNAASFNAGRDYNTFDGDRQYVENEDKCEVTVVSDEGPTERKRGRLIVNLNRLPTHTLKALVKPFSGFPYDPAIKAEVQRLKGLPSKGIKFEPLKRNLLDLRVPPRILPKLKITFSKHGNDQHKVVFKDNIELQTTQNSSQTAFVTIEEEIIPSAKIVSNPPVDEPTRQGLDQGIRSTSNENSSSKMRESRDWKPSTQYFKPLNAGWVREVIFDREVDGKYKSKPKEINYYSPEISGGKQQKFRTMSDLGAYLKSSNSEFSLANFSFRTELMNATDGQEVIRANDEISPITGSSKKPVELLPSGSKRSYSTVEMMEQQKVSSKSTSDFACGLKVKTFGRLNSPNISSTDALPPNVTILVKGKEPAKPSERGNLMSKLSKSNVNSTPSLSVPKVTITPAVKGFVTDPALNIQKSMPSISISPSPKQGAPSGANLVKKPSFHNSFGENKQNSSTFISKIIRPLTSAIQSCSAHCPKSPHQRPELSCKGCNSFFHPICIGLEEKVDYRSYHFYCNVCSPPAGKKDIRPRATISAVASCVDSAPTVVITRKPRTVPDISSITTDSRPAPIELVKISPLVRVERPTLPRPIESQPIVNISGKKYLALAKDKGNVGKNASVLLQPAEREGYFPSFEVVEGPDSKLILTPVKPTNGTSSLSHKIRTPSGLFSISEIQRVSSDYFFAMLHVFQYLTISELCTAAQVCKLWNEVAQHRSLWKSVSLSMCHIKNWETFLSVMEDKKVERIDFKRIFIDKVEENFWIEHLTQNIGKLKNVTQVEFQKIPPLSLENFINALFEVKGSRLSNITFLETACLVSRKPLDFAILGNVNHLEQLRINSTTGPLKLLNLGRGLSAFGLKFATTLKVLSVLNTDCLTEDHVKAISELKNLQQLEIGNCQYLSRGFLTSVAKLKKLQCLRLEKATTGDEIGVLSSLKDLKNLELIENEFKPGFDKGFVLLKSVLKTLLIPVYADEPARVNRNLIDSLTNMQNITHFYLGFTNEWLGSLEEIEPNAKGDVIPYEEDDYVVYVSLSKLSKKLQLALPFAQKVKILKMWRRAATRQTLANRKP